MEHCLVVVDGDFVQSTPALADATNHFFFYLVGGIFLAGFIFGGSAYRGVSCLARGGAPRRVEVTVVARPADRWRQAILAIIREIRQRRLRLRPMVTPPRDAVKALLADARPDGRLIRLPSGQVVRVA